MGTTGVLSYSQLRPVGVEHQVNVSDNSPASFTFFGLDFFFSRGAERVDTHKHMTRIRALTRSGERMLDR